MTPIEFEVSWSKVKVTTTFKWGIHVSQTFLVILNLIYLRDKKPKD